MSDPVVHKLKCAAVYFDAVQRGDKHFLIRLDDKGFQKGDIVQLYRLPHPGVVTCRLMGSDPYEGMDMVARRISWILTDGCLGLRHGHVALSLESV